MQEVIPLDLLARQRQLPAAVKVMAKIARQLALGTRRTLPFLVRQRAKVTPSEVVVRAKAHGATATGASYAVKFEAQEGSGWALLLLDPSAVLMILEGCLGGAPSTEANKLEMGALLSAAQRALLKGVTARLAEEVRLAVADETQVRMTAGDGMSLSAGDLLDLADDALRVDLEISETGTPARITLFVGAEALEAAARVQEAAEQSTDPRMTEAMRGAELAIVAELGRITLGLGQVLALRPGETLRLPTALDDAISIRVQGIPKFNGTPTISRGQVAVKINGRVE